LAEFVTLYHSFMDGSHATATDKRTTHARLQDLIETGRAVIGVIGLGYVGLPLVRAFAGSGFRCLGFDIDRSKVLKLGLPLTDGEKAQAIRALLAGQTTVEGRP